MSKNEKRDFPFKKQNYQLIIIGVVTVTIGFLLMMGGGSDDPNVFSEAVFSFRRITLAPIVLLAGYGLVLFGIIKKEKKD